MVLMSDILQDVAALLEVERFSDYAPNGLQVEGKPSVQKIVTGVTASKMLIEAAIQNNADALLVHHGFFWRNEPAPITGMKKERIRLLLAHNINLLAYHLPLDAHTLYGNNAMLAKYLNFQTEGILPSASLVFHGTTLETTPQIFSQNLEKLSKQPVLHLPGNKKKIHKIAWCTGAAQSFFIDAIYAGVDAFITGEVSENCTHLARESGVHFFAMGHHASERYGVQALGDYLAKKFNIEHQFIEINNPV